MATIFRERLSDDLGISRRCRRRGFASFELVFAKSVKFVRLFDGRLVTFAFFGENVQQDWFLLRFQKLKCPDQQRDVVSVDRSVVTQAELLENDARHN